MVSNKEDRLKALKRLQQKRSGKSFDSDEEDHEFNSYSANEDKLYDVMDEKAYKDKKRKDMLNDNFVVDDDGDGGYIDNGVDEWDREDQYYSDEDMENDKKSDDKRAKNKSSKNDISSLINKHAAKSHVKQKKSGLFGNMSTEKKSSNKVSVDMFDDIFNEYGDENDSSSFKKSSTLKRKQGFTDSKKSFNENDDDDDDDDFKVTPPNSKRLKFSNNIDYSPTRTSHKHISNNSSPLKNILMDSSPEKNPTVKAEDKKDSVEPKADSLDSNVSLLASDSSDGDDDDDEILALRKRRTIRSGTVARTVNLKSGNTSFTTAPTSPNTSGMNDSSADINSSPTHMTKLTGSSNPFSKKLEKESIYKNEDESVPFYWLDYCEINNTLVLYGKIKSNDGKFYSSMVQIEGLYRELYFLPKEGNNALDINEQVSSTIMEKYGLTSLRAKPEKMKYAFELPNIPRKEYEYLKVLFPFDTPKNSFRRLTLDFFPQDSKIQHIFGATANIFESFVVQRKIMGPCWLDLKNVEFDKLAGASHCNIELKINKPTDVVVHSGSGLAAPPLTTLTLSVQSLLNVQENKQEVVSISYKVNKDLDLEGDSSSSNNSTETVTLFRPPSSSSFPVTLKKLTEKKFPNDPVRLFNNEKGLLSCFAALLKQLDPDVFMGHKLETVGLDIIMNRMYDLKVSNFSSIGRLNRREWPDRWVKNKTHQFYLIRDILSGRLVCDIGNELGQSLTSKCQSWELSEMYNLYTGNVHKPLEINFNQPQFQDDPSFLVMAIDENITNCRMINDVANKIQILSLSKQLTTLAGNNWNQTLSGNRAARNEYILLHEFAREGFIVPDKDFKNNADQMNSQGRSKKSKYQGGLVFEPERGLHKNFVLVMDFNSLYPSIIQEFNICFTTVEREHLLNTQENDSEQEALPALPESTKGQGVLPKLLNSLVARRREVKKLMKTESDPFKIAQCDIRQQALKLTANSMYGCLGFVNSRFYAKPLAMLVTNKGREILMNTRQLAEAEGLNVVYGDTDSVMIDTGSIVYNEAIKIGEGFKRNVNDRYKLLEIDIDNIFKKLLLHAKKKYAALNCTIDPKTHEERLVLEVKGLDMKRREYCPLSKEVSEQVLQILLSDKFSDSEAALHEVYDYLEGISDSVVNGKYKFDKFRINTKLSKDPTQYPGGKTMPAVQVALRMRKSGRIVKAGSVITFVITKSEGVEGEDSKEDLSTSKEDAHFAERARAFTELLAKNSNLKPDNEYYLEKQIFVPIKRLLETIEGFDVARLADSLKLDSKIYLKNSSTTSSYVNGINDLQPLESTIGDSERFRDCQDLVIHCSACSSSFKYHGIVKSNDYLITFNGIKCKKCDNQLRMIQLTSQVENRIRGFINKYYEGWLQCDDTTCNCRTRSISMYGKKCLVEGCTGVVNYTYNDKMLYNQLLYFSSLFDFEKNLSQKLRIFSNTNDDERYKLRDSEIKALVEQNRELLFVNKQVVHKYLSDCARSYVNMTDIFAFGSSH